MSHNNSNAAQSDDVPHYSERNTSHPSTAPGTYTFPPGSKTNHMFTDHLRSFTCKIAGQPRPQYRSFATTKGSNTAVRMFSPSKANQNSFKAAFKEALNQAPSGLFRCNNNPCAVTVKFFFPRPKHHYCVRPKGTDWPLKSNAPKFVATTPDIDNCVKLVLDALQGVAFKTDACVVHIACSKLYDHTQLVYRDGVQYVGTTLLKVVEIDPTVAVHGCSCIVCSK